MPASRGARSPARRRSGPWSSWRSWSRSGATSTPARSAGSAGAATPTGTSPSAPRPRRRMRSTGAPAAGSPATASPRRSIASRWRRPKACDWRSRACTGNSPWSEAAPASVLPSRAMTLSLPRGTRLPDRAVWLNGRIVRGEGAVVSVFDRGVRDGGGLFETLRVYAGKPFAWDRHMERLVLSAAELGFPVPPSPRQLRGALDEVLEANALADAVVRITVTRGVAGGR